ncbi:MAG: hypothetical protein AAGG46_04235 [Planctomycetota bacterium]
MNGRNENQNPSTSSVALRGMAAAGVCVLAFLSSGCRTLEPDADTPALPPISETTPDRPALLPWKDEEPEIGTAAQIVATWTDTVLQESGVGASRGFGGRLYFYGSSDAKPIAVDGQLVVYAFDETDRKATDNKPNKRYVFPPDQFALHRSQSDLGVSYSFWLPWDTVGGKQRDVSLIARFEPVRGGALVVSEQSTVRLPGQFDEPAVTPGEPEQRRIGSVQTVSHTAPVVAPQAGEEKKPIAAKASAVETTTIRLPSNHRILQSSGGGSRSPTSRPQATPTSTSRTTVKYLTPAESAERRLGAAAGLRAP